MNFPKIVFLALSLTLIGSACNTQKPNTQTFDTSNMMIRIAELEIDASSLDNYLAILKEEAEASVRLEPGVICIYPMFEKENPTEIRLLEIYVNKDAYEAHLLTPHFKKYKSSTLEMVKSLNLIDMKALDQETMTQIFRKLP
ncbi:MAG: putative quinol monooxygenase [Bacteroidia bacterium]|nr:putative quinol monooxygenase [Bacteroidia bacterium]